MVYIEEEYSILLEPELAGDAALIHWRIRFKPGGLSHWVKVSNPLTKLLCSYTMSLLKASVPISPPLSQWTRLSAFVLLKMYAFIYLFISFKISSAHCNFYNELKMFLQ